MLTNATDDKCLSFEGKKATVTVADSTVTILCAQKYDLTEKDVLAFEVTAPAKVTIMYGGNLDYWKSKKPSKPEDGKKPPDFQAITPEPRSLLLLGTGLAAILALRRGRRHHKAK